MEFPPIPAWHGWWSLHSVDPYYLTHKAQEIGYHPEVILSGRKVNDNMPQYACSILVKYMSRSGLALHDAKILVMGLSFKEDCPDIRNTKFSIWFLS